MPAPPIAHLLREALDDAAAVLLPVECAGCGSPDRALCRACRGALGPDPVLRGVDGLPVWAALRYEGVARRVLLALKESGRTDLARHLAPAIVAAVRRVPPGVELCLVPSSRRGHRRRGYDPLRMIAARGGLRVRRLLVRTRDAASQKTLGIAARSENAAGSLRARRDLTGRRIVIVDDVVTSGATLRESRRALLAAGAEVLGAAVIATTPRRLDPWTDLGGSPRPMPGDTGAGAD